MHKKDLTMYEANNVTIVNDFHEKVAPANLQERGTFTP